jgi:two-component system sensor histidine kinase VicK
MFKSVQVKIILIIMVLAILMFLSYGIYTIQELQNSNIQNEIINKNIFVFIIITAAFVGISIIVIWFTSRVITRPIYKLIKSAEKIAEGEELKIDNSKRNTEIDGLIQAFDTMTVGLNENLNKVTRQKKQIETILQYMTDGIMAFDLNGNIIHINSAAITLLGLTGPKNNFNEIFKSIDLDVNLEKIIYLEDWAKSERKIINVKDKYLKIFFASFKDELERPAGAIVLIQDITEHVRLDNMRKEFIADVSHELKTPLTSIMGYAETLANSEYDPEMQEKFLKVINNESIRMTKLVNDLLILSKYDNEQIECEKIEFNLGELVKSCLENLQIEADKKNQKVECFVTANVPTVKADKDGIERVVLNILSNSIKYTEDGGVIKIYVGFVYNDAYIKIIDNGIGIPEKDLDRIFERFYRVDKARTRKMGGTGLGLSIAKEILDKNNGRIDIKSKVGKGTEVVITIPTILKNEA